MSLSIFGSVIMGLEYTAKSQVLLWRISNLVLAYIDGGRKLPIPVWTNWRLCKIFRRTETASRAYEMFSKRSYK